jgi:hypothetical protein
MAKIWTDGVGKKASERRKRIAYQLLAVID